jgi:hypothetical protein
MDFYKMDFMQSIDMVRSHMVVYSTIFTGQMISTSYVVAGNIGSYNKLTMTPRALL